MKLKANNSLASKYNLYLILVLSSLIILIALASLLGETYKYKKDSKRFREYLLEQKKVEMKNKVTSCIHSIDVLRTDYTNQMKSKIKDRVNEGYNIAVSLYENNKNTKSKQEIIELIKTALGSYTFFNNRGYYFIISLDGKGVLDLDNSHLENNNILKVRDTEGRRPIKKILSLFETKDEGYVEYSWATPSKEEISYQKTSFVKRLPFYNMIIGTGEYCDALEKDLQKRVLKLISDLPYDNQGDIFVNTFDGKVKTINSLSIKPGDDFTHYKDENGVSIFEKQYKNAIKSDGGYYNYKWFEPGIFDYRDNIAYVKAIPEWEWIIGSFVNVSSIDMLIEKNKIGLYQSAENRMLVAICIMILLAVLILLVGRKFRKRINVLFTTFFNELKDAVKYRRYIKEDTLQISEYAQMARMANDLLENQQEVFERLENSEQRFRLLIKHVPVMILGLDKDNNVTVFNKEIQKFTGKRAVNTIGKKFRLEDFFDDDVAEKIKGKYKSTKHQFMLRSYHTKNGTKFSHVWRHFGTSVEEKILVGYDITDQVKKEQEINDQKELLETLIETMPLPIFYKDIESGTYLGCNTAYSKFLNIPVDKIIGSTLTDLYPREQAQKMLQKDQELINNGDVQVYESSFCAQEGDMRYGKIYKAKYKNYLGENAGILGISMDITDSVNYEKNLEELNNTKDRFFSILAHDLKNPFNSLLGILEILREDYDELHDDERKQYLEVLDRTSYRLFRLLTNLLDWSRTQIDGVKFEPDNINVTEVVHDTVKVLQHQADHKHIEFVLNINEDVIVYADYNMISSVVRNLINNAIKFSNKGGKIKISIEKFEGAYRISVMDNGVGMKEDVVNKLFRIDEKISTKGTASEVGTGLGLILCKEFINKHQGTIDVQSVEGEGSTFSFTLPIYN